MDTSEDICREKLPFMGLARDVSPTAGRYESTNSVDLISVCSGYHVVRETKALTCKRTFRHQSMS